MAPENGNRPSAETKAKDAPSPAKDTQATQGSAPPAQTKPKETEVTLWLKENNAGEFAPMLFEKGFYYIKDIDDKDLEGLFKDKPGIRNMLTRLVKEEKEKNPVPEIPKLPEGTKLDLSLKKLELPSGIKFEIPNALQVPRDDKGVVAPGSLTPEQWMFVARNSCLLYGRRMDGMEPVVASYPVLHWKVPKSNNFMRSEHLAAEVKSELTYTETSSNYVRQGFSKVNATLRVPYCAASVEREDNEKHASSAKVKQLFMTGIWHYPRARVLLQECSEVSPDFVREIRTALKEALGLDPDSPKIEAIKEKVGLNTDQPTDEQKQAAKVVLAKVEGVLLRYGHMVGWTVDVGGRLFFVHHKEEAGTINSHERTETTRAAIGIKTSNATGEVGVAIGSGEADVKEAYKIAETTTFTALGGDATLASNPQAWASTVKDPNLWAVIGMEEVKSTIDLLPEPLHELVHQIWKAYGRWGHLDGRLVRLEKDPFWTSIASILIAGGDGGVSGTDNCYQYLHPDETIWTIKCFRDDIYWIQHRLTQKLLTYTLIQRGGSSLPSLATIGPEVMTNWTYNPYDPYDHVKAMWHIHPADPEATHGDQYRNCYLIENIYHREVLCSSTAQSLQFVSLPPTGFSLEAKYVRDPGKTFLEETTATSVANKEMVSAKDLIWKLEPVEDA